ncbi:MAG: Uma2 family endonuclease [Thermoanaerobaculia bacterium]
MQQALRHYSVAEYFAIEQMSDLRHEFLDGAIYGRPGGSRNHNRIALNLSRMIDAAVAGSCMSYVADLRLRTPSGLYTYPDVMVICGPAQLTDEPLETVTNPVVLVEVLSSSTRDYDRNGKFDLYRAIPTLRDYLLVDQYSIDVEHRWLVDGDWRSERRARREDALRLVGVAVDIQLSGVYDRVEF